MSQSPVRSNEETPLRKSPVYVPSDREVAQELDGYSYTLNPSRFEPPPLTLTTASWKGIKLATIVILSPILLLGSLTCTSIMYFAPQTIQHWVFSKFLSKICGALDSRFGNERTTLLSNTRGSVLDLGSGSGAYMKYLVNAERVVALEPMSKLHATIQAQADKWLSPKETEFDLLESTLESYLEQFPDQAGTFDWIVLGNVMCEVPNPMSTLNAVDRALKNGGKVYFSEHIACSTTHAPWKRSVQHLVNPWWKIVSGGCNMNRDTLEWIQAMPHWHVIVWEFPHVNVGLGPFVLGLAQKRPNSNFVRTASLR